MAAPKSPIELSGEGYYWAQIYVSETEELTPPCVVQIFKDRESGKMRAAWLGAEQPLIIPERWVWLAKLEPPEGLVADLTS